MIYRVFIVLIFVAIIVGSVMLGGAQREAVSPTAVDEKAGDLGYAARTATIIETGADGRPLYTIDAALINKAADSAPVEAQQVKLGFRDAAGNEWTGRAQRGELGEDTGNVELSGDVHISGILPGIEEPVNMATEQLHVDTHAQTVATDRAVTLIMTGREIRAKGLAANLKDGLVHLQSNVHGNFSK
jgi:LPS export ABC transporter protein LptC